MNKQLRGLIAKAVLAAGAVLLIGCDGDSNGIGEDGDSNGGAELPDLRMHVMAASSGQLSAWVSPKDGSAEALELEEGQSFWASAAGSPVDLAAEPARLTTNVRDLGLKDIVLFRTVFYQDASPILAATLDRAANDRYYVVYNEDGREEGASYATIPQPFQITAPLPHEVVSLANDLVVNWDDPGTVSEVLVHAAVFCDGSSNDQEWLSMVLGSGERTLTIPGSALSNEFMTDTCELMIEVATGREGIPGLGFGGSEVVGYRISTVTLTATR